MYAKASPKMTIEVGELVITDEFRAAVAQLHEAARDSDPDEVEEAINQAAADVRAERRSSARRIA